MSAEDQAYDFWNSAATRSKARDMAHWRGVGRWADDDAWREVGRRHVAMTEAIRNGSPMHRMLELGPGGGCNVLAFADHFEEIVGVDVSSSTLEQCSLQVADHAPAGLKWTAVQIDSAGQAGIAGLGPFDFFLCTAVVQHMPTAAWAERVFRLIAGEMRDHGRALVQFRTRRARPNPGQGYERNVARWLTFHPPDFYKLIENAGWNIIDARSVRGCGMYTSLEAK